MSTRKLMRRGFTLTEMLVIIGMIAVMLSILLPALRGAFSTGEMTESMNRLRQIGYWMEEYSSENRDRVLPSQFKYVYEDPDQYRGKVRTGELAIGKEHQGTWTDILWTVFDLAATAEVDASGAIPEVGGEPLPTYRFDSPDKDFYEIRGPWKDNPLRSSAANTRNAPEPPSGEAIATPFGEGAREVGDPGYFAANNFFNADSSLESFGWYTRGQNRMPSQSMYLVDSFYGETIGGGDAATADALGLVSAFDIESQTEEVDFRYNDSCLMLMLDGHVEPQTRWGTLKGLEIGPVRVRNLTQRRTNPG